MDKHFKRTTITSALPYANGPVHIGHLAGVYVPADIYARYLRLKGRECLFIGGSDEHGVPVTIRARKPNYFADYDTSVTFISEEEMKQQHSALPHGGMVFRTGRTGLNGEHSHTIEYRLSLDSNPEFTAGVLVALARAVVRMNRRGNLGCKTVFDVAPADLSPLSPEALRATML